MSKSKIKLKSRRIGFYVFVLNSVNSRNTNLRHHLSRRHCHQSIPIVDFRSKEKSQQPNRFKISYFRFLRNLWIFLGPLYYTRSEPSGR